jgi:DNA-binding transcriptional regulator GbsR (MarR family)
MCEKKGMEFTPNYDQGHLVVAAARVLEHLNSKPPTMEEIGGLLKISHEVIGAVARALESRGIVKIHKTPFDTRVEVIDHTGLEELPREDTGAAIQEEVEAFKQRSKEKQEEIEKLFGGDFQKKKKEKQAELEAQLKDFQKKRAVDPFEKSEEEGEEENAKSEALPDA